MEKEKEQLEDEMIDKAFNALITDYLNSSHRKKTAIIEKAFHFARKAHAGVRRRSGEPYIMHPLAVARIVAKEIGLGSTSICSALLHDVVEDTEYTTEGIANIFGDKIASIVDGLTKISGGVFADEASKQAENFRKLLLTMSEDIRVVLIKMADRLHNMRTLSSMPLAKQHKIAGETQYIYAPLAHRLGLFAIKTELENLSFKYEHPETYREIEEKLESTKEERTTVYKEFAKPIKEKLATLPFKIEISSRIKSIFSIWNKMQRKNVSFSEIYDLLAMRIVFDMGEEEMNIEEERALCWQIYSIITSLYKPHPDRTRDWISTPKANGYEALHVTVMDTHGNWIEVQIRSRRMDDIAEKGFAAHWKYKEGYTAAEQKESELDKWLKTIKELLENPDSNAMDFLDTFKLSLFASEIFIFTPKGDIKTMPIDSTVLDFAFFLHTDLGMHCIGAKVNHKLMPLNYKLQAGDQVEILTSQKQHPQPEWIDFVNTARAKKEIKNVFKLEYRAFSKKGEKELSAELKKYGMALTPETVERILSGLNIHDEENLYYKIGKGVVSVEDVKKILKLKKTQNKLVNYWKLNFFGFGKKNGEEQTKDGKQPIDKKKTMKVTDEAVGKVYKIAPCCNPIPGDDIIGFVDENGTIIVHKRDCPIAVKNKASFGDNIVSAEWATHKELSFPAVIEIKGFDKTGILMEILKVISEQYSVNIQKVDVETHEGIFEGTIRLYVHDTEDVNNLCMNILKIKEVEAVNRIYD